MEKQKTSFIGNVLTMNNTFNLTKSSPNCSQRVLTFSPNVANYSLRLGTCPEAKFWANGQIQPILNENAKKEFGLERVDLKCSRIVIRSSYNILWRVNLRVFATTTTGGQEPPFQTLIIKLRCTSSSGSVFIKVAEYDVESK